MNLIFSTKADKSYQKLPSKIQKKTDKQFLYLLNNYRHPSLRTKKMNATNHFEARIDYHYRITFYVEEDTIFILSVGMHDEGLGRK
jgi:mRNA interferase RelE/StbE